MIRNHDPREHAHSCETSGGVLRCVMKLPLPYSEEALLSGTRSGAVPRSGNTFYDLWRFHMSDMAWPRHQIVYISLSLDYMYVFTAGAEDMDAADMPCHKFSLTSR